jgi:hypothetical protein
MDLVSHSLLSSVISMTRRFEDIVLYEIAYARLHTGTISISIHIQC